MNINYTDTVLLYRAYNITKKQKFNELTKGMICRKTELYRLVLLCYEMSKKKGYFYKNELFFQTISYRMINSLLPLLLDYQFIGIDKIHSYRKTVAYYCTYNTLSVVDEFEDNFSVLLEKADRNNRKVAGINKKIRQRIK